jgi:hypothetical protein
MPKNYLSGPNHRINLKLEQLTTYMFILYRPHVCTYDANIAPCDNFSDMVLSETLSNVMS